MVSMNCWRVSVLWFRDRSSILYYWVHVSIRFIQGISGSACEEIHSKRWEEVRTLELMRSGSSSKNDLRTRLKSDVISGTLATQELVMGVSLCVNLNKKQSVRVWAT